MLDPTHHCNVKLLSQFLDSNLITVPDLTQRTMKPRNWNDFLRRSSGPIWYRFCDRNLIDYVPRKA